MEKRSEKDAECISQSYQELYCSLIPSEETAEALRSFLSEREIEDFKATLQTLTNYL